MLMRSDIDSDQIISMIYMNSGLISGLPLPPKLHIWWEKILIIGKWVTKINRN